MSWYNETKGRDRYGSKWHKRRYAAKDMIDGQCSLCRRKATGVHHAYYGFRFLFIHIKTTNLEIPGWSVFPLCDHHHSNAKGMAHHLKNYLIHKNPWDNRNTDSYILKLRISFWIKFILQRLTPFICLALMGFAFYQLYLK